MGDIRFSKRTECWCPFSWSVCNQNGHFIRSIQSSSFQGYGDIHTHHGRTSAKRNSGQKPKLSERDHCTLKRIVSINHRSTAAKVRAELDIHLEDRSTKTVWRELHKSSIHGRAAIAKPLITENSAKRLKRWCDDHKTWPSDDWKYIIWSDEPSMLFPTSGWVYIWTSPIASSMVSIVSIPHAAWSRVRILIGQKLFSSKRPDLLGGPTQPSV